jgi:hypothetical protein
MGDDPTSGQREYMRQSDGGVSGRRAPCGAATDKPFGTNRNHNSMGNLPSPHDVVRLG